MTSKSRKRDFHGQARRVRQSLPVEPRERRVYEIDLTVGKDCSSTTGVRSCPTSFHSPRKSGSKRLAFFIERRQSERSERLIGKLAELAERLAFERRTAAYLASFQHSFSLGLHKVRVVEEKALSDSQESERVIGAMVTVDRSRVRVRQSNRDCNHAIPPEKRRTGTIGVKPSVSFVPQEPLRSRPETKREDTASKERNRQVSKLGGLLKKSKGRK